MTLAKNRRLWIWTVAAIAILSPLSEAHQKHQGHDPRVLETDPVGVSNPIAPVLQGLGEHHYPVTTRSEKAQMFFDQGLKLTYGFNHQEALRSFKEAVRLDPDCAMAYWGWALVLGPNLNLPMSPEVVPQTYEAIQMALARVGRATEKERDFVEALATRYSDDPDADRSSFDRAYADAMKRLHKKYPEDNDAATLYAASVMNLSPWDYWTKDGRPNERTREILDALESVLERDPEHEGALHYYIHAVEAVHPERGAWAADQLRGLTPGAGHLVHMPSHVYMQVGRYADAFEVNRLAIEADEGYITQCRRQGIYPLNYYPHNIHFLTWAAIMQGKSAAALDASRKVASKVPEDMHGNDWALYQSFLSMPLYTMVRFGMWDEILAEPEPDEGTRFWEGIWHYARGLAFVNTGRAEKAQRELDAIQRIVDDPTTPEVLIGFTNASSLLGIARGILSGELEAKRGNFDEAILELDRAVRLQEGLLYTEPPDWYYPVRHTLGAVLLDAGRPEEAEVVFWQDLEQNEENGYALFGLAQSLRAQGKTEAAGDIEERFRRAWADADVELSTSRF